MALDAGAGRAVADDAEVEDLIMVAFFYRAAGDQRRGNEYAARPGPFAGMLDEFFTVDE